MKLYKNNRRDGEYELSPAEIAERFAASRYAEMLMQTERTLRLFMASAEADGGLASTWTDESDAGFGAVLDEAIRLTSGREA